MDLVEKKDDPFEAVANTFRKMGDLVTKNIGEKFGGAFVIVDPDGKQVESLFINEGTAGLFWGTLKAIVEQQLSEIDSKERNLRAGFGTR